MRILFALRGVRHLSSTIALLAQRGHELVVVADGQAGSETAPAGVSTRPGVGRERSAERDLARALRSWVDYLWFFEPEFDDATKLRARAAEAVPSSLREGTAAAAQDPDLRRALSAAIGALERALPVPETYLELVESEDPDLVVVSPLLPRGSPQVNYLRAARRLGIATAYCVASWDNLTTKGVRHDDVDLVTVWNEAQKGEAVTLHRVPADRVAVTGAPVYDEWFGRRPSTTRAEFCERIGLPDRPYVLYACSSHFIAPNEGPWILEWLDGVRGSGLRELADVPVLIRPHPANRLAQDAESAADLSGAVDVAIHPPTGVEVSTERDLQEYYDSLHHAAAVVGINTSAMVEAALVRRGVYVPLADRYRTTQDGVPHFAHLRTAGGGLIHATAHAGEHAEALARAVRGEDAEEAAERARAFVAEFIRPHGLDQPATPRLADALEALAAKPRRPAGPAPGPSQEWLDRVAAELEPIFHIRRGRSIGSRPVKKERAARETKPER